MIITVKLTQEEAENIDFGTCVVLAVPLKELHIEIETKANEHSAFIRTPFVRKIDAAKMGVTATSGVSPEAPEINGEECLYLALKGN